ncbi:right-handed parallel beta-helix repeat-containing protein [Nonomuraea wenchangensis]
MLACALPTSAWALGGDHRGETTVACGQVITRSIKLANDLHDCPSNGLEVGAPNITIDLNGHTIDGEGRPGFDGINNDEAGSSSTGHSRVTIKNGTVTGFTAGIALGDGADRNLIERVLAARNDIGISVVDVDRPYIRDSAATLGLAGIGLRDVTNARVERSTALENGSGIALTGTSTGSVLYRNSAVNNVADGIFVASSVTGTRIYNNDANGNGTATGAPTEDGIDVDATDAATVIRGNRARNNGDLGIEATPGVTDGGGNRASGNGNPAQCLNITCTP